MGVKLVTGRRREPRKNREAGWLLIYFFLRPPLFSIGTKEGSFPPASRHPARNLTLCKQPERKKDETGYTNRHSRGSLGEKKKNTRPTVRVSSCPLYYSVSDEKARQKARCTVQSRVYVRRKNHNKVSVIIVMSMRARTSSLMRWFNERSREFDFKRWYYRFMNAIKIINCII